MRQCGSGLLPRCTFESQDNTLLEEATNVGAFRLPFKIHPAAKTAVAEMNGP